MPNKLFDHTNKTYNFLTCLERSRTRNGKTMWKCLCVCGKTKHIPISDILKGDIKSCGCKRSELIGKRGLPDEVCAFRCIYRNTRKRANRREQIFDLNELDFEKLIKSNCYYCNRIPSNWLYYN